MVQSYEERTSTTSRSDEIWAARERWVPRGVSTYAHVVVKRAHGAEVWDVDGKRYIDFAGGIGTLNAGHTPPEVVQAVQEQAEELIHMCFSVAIYEPYVELARRLAEVTPGSFAKKTILVNSGAEAVENAVKIARFATARPNIISFQNAFHGRTLMGMTLTGKDRPYKDGFGPFAPASSMPRRRMRIAVLTPTAYTTWAGRRRVRSRAVGTWSVCWLKRYRRKPSRRS